MESLPERSDMLFLSLRFFWRKLDFFSAGLLSKMVDPLEPAAQNAPKDSEPSFARESYLSVNNDECIVRIVRCRGRYAQLC